MWYPTEIRLMEDTVVVHRPTIKMATVMKKVQVLECQAVVLVVVAVLTEQDLLAVAVEIDVSSLIAMDKNLIEAVISQVCVELFCLFVCCPSKLASCVGAALLIGCKKH